MLQVTVKRSEWLRGEGADNSFLYRGRDSKMCCLGFFCEAAGIPRKDFRGIKTPARLCISLRDAEKVIPAALLATTRAKEPLSSSVLTTNHTLHSEAIRRLMEVNDDAWLDDTEREALIIRHGREAGIDFHFVD